MIKDGFGAYTVRVLLALDKRPSRAVRICRHGMASAAGAG
jgi:hypothetical protein